MNCLNEKQLMELLYNEGEREDIKNYKEHIFSCKKCFEEFMNLVEIREYFKNNERENTQVVVIAPPKQNLGTKMLTAAAVIMMALSLVFSGIQIKKIEKTQKELTIAKAELNKKIQEVSYKTEKTAKDNYMLLMGLKNYVDSVYLSNQNTRRVNYERF